MPPTPLKFLITAGPTREPIDAVRFISNRSSGKMGLAIVRAAVEAGASVTLLLGPGPDAAQIPAGCHAYRFDSSAELKQLLEAHFRDCDVLIMAAAVADYRPIEVLEGKLPRDPQGGLTLQLQATPDLVALMAGQKKPGQRIVAFALEEAAHLEARAAEKLRRKRVDAIVANSLGTMEADTVTALWLTAGGQRQALPTMGKADFARWLIEHLLGELFVKVAPPPKKKAKFTG